MGRKTYEFVVPFWDQLAAGEEPPGAEFLPARLASLAPHPHGPAVADRRASCGVWAGLSSCACTVHDRRNATQ